MEEKEFILSTFQLYESTGKTINEDAVYLKNKLDSSGKLTIQDLEDMLRKAELCSGSLGMIHEKLSEYLKSRKDSI